MVKSIDIVLNKIANQDAVPYIIAEIPTNPRVEVPDLIKLKEVLSQERKTATGDIAIDPVFILDQTFCPNTSFLGEDGEPNHSDVAGCSVAEVGVGVCHRGEFKCGNGRFAGAEAFYNKCFAWLDDVATLAEGGGLAIHDIKPIHAEDDFKR